MLEKQIVKFYMKKKKITLQARGQSSWSCLKNQEQFMKEMISELSLKVRRHISWCHIKDKGFGPREERR